MSDEESTTEKDFIVFTSEEEEEELVDQVVAVREITEELINKFAEGGYDYKTTMVTLLITVLDYVQTQDRDPKEKDFIISTALGAATAIKKMRSKEADVVH